MILAALFVLISVPESVLPITTAAGKISATGVLLDRFTVLTAAHAVGPERTVVFVTCGTKEMAGAVSKRATAHDLALVTLYTSCNEVAVSQLETNDPVEGDSIEVVGYPARELTHTTGTVRGYTLLALKNFKLGNGVFWLAMILGADIRPGNSGGGVYSQNHRLVGIVHGFSETIPGKPGVAVPLSAINQFLTSSEEN